MELERRCLDFDELPEVELTLENGPTARKC
jgi:hypothetical protein